jgi:hypothetical protein
VVVSCCGYAAYQWQAAKEAEQAEVQRKLQLQEQEMRAALDAKAEQDRGTCR